MADAWPRMNEDHAPGGPEPGPAVTAPEGTALIVELRTMFGSLQAAEACAERLVGARVAACVQVEGPLRSTYRWAGAVERAEEFRCTCKTTPEREQACRALLLVCHDYKLPELLVARVQASAEYADWVRAAVTEPANG